MDVTGAGGELTLVGRGSTLKAWREGSVAARFTKVLAEALRGFTGAEGVA
jgi:hypothetical protein